MKHSVVIIGGGGHACVVAEAVRSRDDLFQLRGFVDPDLCEDTVSRLGLPRLGDDSALAAHRDALAVLGVGPVPNSGRCQDVVARLSGLVSKWGLVIHAQAWVSPSATIGDGTVVMAGAIVETRAVVGKHVVVNTSAVVEHDVELGDFVHVSPAAALGGGAVVEEGAYIGLGSRIRDHITVGKNALIGMGAVVVQDVAAGSCVMGVPARVMEGRSR